jgi:uncharacterized membrane protein
LGTVISKSHMKLLIFKQLADEEWWYAFFQDPTIAHLSEATEFLGRVFGQELLIVVTCIMYLWGTIKQYIYSSNPHAVEKPN